MKRLIPLLFVFLIGFTSPALAQADTSSTCCAMPRLSTASTKQEITARLSPIRAMFWKISSTKTASSLTERCHAWSSDAEPDWKLEKACTTKLGALLRDMYQIVPDCAPLLTAMKDPKMSDHPWRNERAAVLESDTMTLVQCERVYRDAKRMFPEYAGK